MPSGRLEPTPRNALPHRARAARLLALAALCLVFTGCNNVFRRLTVRSDPPGALVLVDGEEIGYTPATVDFTYYGTREITLIKDGYETLTVLQKVSPPWYQYPGIDFFFDNFSPTQVTDRQQFLYKLQPQVVVPSERLLDRANNLRSESQIGQ